MSAKDLVLRPISRAESNKCVKAWHYSGKPYPKSQMHVGVFWSGRLRGALTFGDPLDRRRVLGLVAGTPWEGMVELNRMALAPELPKNCESRAISVAVRILKKAAPQLEWILSFADGAQCGDGTIYRAAGWWLTGIRPNSTLWRDESGRVLSDVGIRTTTSLRAEILEKARAVDPSLTWQDAAKRSTLRAAGLEPIPGFQLRYICPLKPCVRERLNVPILPYSEIDARGARMYLGRAYPKEGP